MPPGGDPTDVLGRRIGAYVIDAVLLLIIVFAVMVPKFDADAVTVPAQGLTCEDLSDARSSEFNSTFCFQDGNELRVIPEDKEDSFVATAWITIIGTQALNWILLQGLTGASVGKLLVGLRVVRRDGRVANIGWAALRWLLLIVDGIICGLLPGIVLVSSTKGHRRLGDMAANTFVVRKAYVGQPVIVPGLTAGASSYAAGYTAPTYGAPPGWGADVPPTAPGGWGGPPATGSGAPFGSPASPSAPSAPTAPSAAPGADAPSWDAARNAYIQYDRELASWMQWDDASNQWKPISQ